MTMTESRDEVCDRLLRKVADGDSAALGELFTGEAGRLIAVARRIVRRPELAEEAVQESFVSIWQRAGAFDPEGARRAPG